MRKRKNHSDHDKAAALAALALNGGNVAKTARQLGIPESTLRLWASGCVPPGTAETCEEKKRSLAESVEAFADDMLAGLLKRIEDGEAKFPDMVEAFATAVDKLLLLRGDPTSITRSQGDAGGSAADLGRLTRAELLTMADLHAKARGETFENASDLDDPVVYTPDGDADAEGGDQPAAVPFPRPALA